MTINMGTAMRRAMEFMGRRIRVQGLNFRCRPGFVGLAAVTVLVGCSSGAGNWTKPSLDASQRSADFADCQAITRQETQRDYAIDQDITASRGSMWHNLGIFREQSATVTSNDAEKSDALLQSCMMGKGYEPAK